MLQNMQWFQTWKRVTEFKDPSNVRPFLAGGAGLQQLGAGAFSVVFALDDDWVVKVTKACDSASQTYLRWCMRNQGVEGVPEILAMHKFGKGRFAVVLRRYIKADVFGITDEARAFIEAVTEGEGVIGKACHNIIETSYAWLDLHRQNYMFDSSGRVFITDPLAS